MEKEIKLRIERRIEKLKKSSPAPMSDVKDTKKHGAMKHWKGRISEAKYILKEVNKIINSNTQAPSKDGSA